MATFSPMVTWLAGRLRPGGRLGGTFTALRSYDLGNVQDEMFAPKSKTWVINKKLAEAWDQRPKTERAK